MDKMQLLPINGNFFPSIFGLENSERLAEIDNQLDVTLKSLVDKAIEEKGMSKHIFCYAINNIAQNNAESLYLMFITGMRYAEVLNHFMGMEAMKHLSKHLKQMMKKEDKGKDQSNAKPSMN